MAINSASNCLPPSTAVPDPADARLDALLTWLGTLIREHGTGEYLLQVKPDGSVTVKRPRKPLEYEWR